MLIFTAKEVEAAKLVALKREVKGDDFKNHNGARGLVHEDKKRKDKSKKWNKQWE